MGRQSHLETMGRIADAMRANLDRIRELDQRQEELINKLLDTTQRLIDEANIEISKLDRFDD